MGILKKHITISKLRPKQCVLAGFSGTHCVCVCTTQQNITFMVCGASIDAVTHGDLEYSRHCLAALHVSKANVLNVQEQVLNILKVIGNTEWRADRKIMLCLVSVN